MRFIRKTAVLLMICTMLVNMPAFASGDTLPVIEAGKILANEDGANTDIYIDSDFVLNISARLEDGLGGQVIGAVCYKEKEGSLPVVVYADQLSASTGNCELTFKKFKFPLDADDGKYTVVISGEGITKENSKSADVFFYGPQSMKAVISQIVKADKDGIEAVLKSPFDGGDILNSDILQLDKDEFNSLEASGKEKLCILLDRKDNDFAVIDTLVLPDDADSIMTLAGEFVKFYNRALPIGKYYDANTADEMSKWFENYKNDSDPLYDFDGNPSSDDMYLKQSAVLSGALEAIKKADKSDKGSRLSTVYKSLAETKADFTLEDTADSVLKKITDKYRESIILAVAEHMPSARLQTLIEDDYAGKLFGNDVLSAYGALTSQTDKDDAISKVSGNKYAGLDALCTAITNAIDDVSDGDNGGGNDGGGNSPGGKGSSVSVSGAPTAGKSNEHGFTDLYGSEWAKEAIDYLYKENIVNGKTPNTFDPKADVTRSEFVKMIVTALGFATQGNECEFADLSASMWQYPYIAVASSFGIVSGYEDGRFGINDAISRQDMAVIACRALKAYGKEFNEYESNSFADSDKISPYAVSSVNILSAIGAINGMPDGTYAPRDNVTRAQAAVIIYRILKEI